MSSGSEVHGVVLGSSEGSTIVHNAQRADSVAISDGIKTAIECLTNAISDITARSNNGSLGMRKSYWRILRAKRHLTTFEKSIPRLPEPPVVLVEAQTSLIEKVEQRLLDDEPVTAQIASEIPAASVTAFDYTRIPDLLPVNSITAAMSDIAQSNVVAEDRSPETADITVATSHAPPETIDAVNMSASDLDDPMRDHHIKLAALTAEILNEYSDKMGTTTMESSMNQWLGVSKGYWSSLRSCKIDDTASPPPEVPSVMAPLPLCYTCPLQRELNLAILAPPLHQENVDKVDLTADRMHMLGFAGIAKKLPLMHPADVTLTLWGVEKFDQWPTQPVSTNPSYTYEDNPLPGWSKNICVRMGGKAQGSIEITYSPPERTKRLRSRIEIQAYVAKNNLSSSLISRFDFRSVFCVCHTHEDGGSYLECSFGRAGCNRWLHSDCVGLGKRKEGELRDMDTVLCPLCTVYLESIGAVDYMKNKRCLRKITTVVPQTSAKVDGFEVFESCKPHTVWGLTSARVPSGTDTSTARTAQASYSHSVGDDRSSSSSSSSKAAQSGNGNLVLKAKGQILSNPSTTQQVKGGSHVKSPLIRTPLPITPIGSDINDIPLPISTNDFSDLRVYPPGSTVALSQGAVDMIPLEEVALNPASPARTSVTASPVPLSKGTSSVAESKILPITKTNKAPLKPLASDPILARMFMHRLFQGASSTEEDDLSIPIESIFKSEVVPLQSLPHIQIQVQVPPLEQPEIEDTEHALVHYSDSVQPRDRVRWARIQQSHGDVSFPSSSSSSSSAVLPSRHILVRVTGGWMKKVGDDSHSRDILKTSGTVLIPGYDESSTTSIPSVAQRVRERALAVAMDLTSVGRDFSSRGRRRLLEAVTISAYSTANRKKIAGSVDEKQPGYYNLPLSSPLLFYLPCEGGVEAACVTNAPVPSSLQSLCSNGEICAFCLAPIPPGTKLFSPAYVASIMRRREKEKKLRAAKRRKLSVVDLDFDSEDDRPEPAKFLVSKEVGAATFVLHQQCAFAADNGGILRVLSTLLSDPVNPQSSDNTRTGESAGAAIEHDEVEMKKILKGVELGDFYECDEADDAECDLCGRAGGMMQFFDLDPKYSSLSPPGEEGWLGHIPCISWLVSSRLLECPPFFLTSSDSLPPDSTTETTLLGKRALSTDQSRSPTHSTAAVFGRSCVQDALNEADGTNASPLILLGSVVDVDEGVIVTEPNNVVLLHDIPTHGSLTSPSSSPEDTTHAAKKIRVDDLTQQELEEVGEVVGLEVTEGAVAVMDCLVADGSDQLSQSQVISADEDCHVDGAGESDLPQGDREGVDEEEPDTNMDATPSVATFEEDVDRGADPCLSPVMTDINCAAESVPALDISVNNSDEDRREVSVLPLSLFDTLAGQWRCTCCGTYAGVVLKCAAPACTVRAHPLCASIAGDGWTAFTINTSDTRQHTQTTSDPVNASPPTLGFLCALHSPREGV